ncbi:hypothetical protein [Nocardia sp. NPDC019302]
MGPVPVDALVGAKAIAPRATPGAATCAPSAPKSRTRRTTVVTPL